MTSNQIPDIFTAQSTSAVRFMSDRGQGFYIPAYQRQFSWDKGNIERLFDNAGHGVYQLLKQADATTFIGTLITIHDTEYVSVEPIVRGQVPSRVMTVIDGQQRLTTLMLMNIALYDEIYNRHLAFKKTKRDPQIHAGIDPRVWIYERCVQTLDELADTIQENMNYGDDDFQWYPRMIRAYEDQWSRYASEARYTSEIASLLHSYGIHIRHSRQNNSRSKYRPTTDGKVSRDFQTIKRTLTKAIARGDHKEIEFPQTVELSTSVPLASTLFNDQLPDEVKSELVDESATKYHELFRLLIFARFVLHRVAITVVTTKSEDYAFDMFEALNSTGEPLTAFETFRPRVINEEGHAHYNKSESEPYMRQIEEYLDNFRTAQSRQQATSSLLIPFALAECGHRLPKRLSDQRRFLKDRYDELDSVQKRSFVRELAYTTRLVRDAWDLKSRPQSGPALADLAELDSQEKMCLDVLRQANHSVTIAPITRFYSAQCEGHSVELDEALLAITAFFALWRGAKGGTSGIDDKYRTLMARGDSNLGIPPFARYLNKKSYAPDAQQLKSYCRACLAGDGIDTRESWVAVASRIPVYSDNQPLTRLLLLAAMHDTMADPSHPGLVMKARPGVLPLLDYESWSDNTKVTVEHIAPQRLEASDDWDSTLYAQPELKDCLGNLLLLPQARNTSISNRKWEHKRAIYRILSAQSEEEAHEALTMAQKDGVKVNPEILEEEYLPLTAGVAAFDGIWDKKIVEQRSQLLCGLAWDQLAPWLGFEEQLA